MSDKLKVVLTYLRDGLADAEMQQLAADEIDRLRAELDALRGQEPSFWYLPAEDDDGEDALLLPCRDGTSPSVGALPLYAAPVPPAAVADVPTLLAIEVTALCDSVNGDFYQGKEWEESQVHKIRQLLATTAPCATCDELRDNLSDALGGRLHTDDEKARMIDGLLEMIGRISDALGISKEDQSVASGDEEILFAIEELKAATPAPVAQKVPDVDAVRQAVARAWCSPVNSGKEMDVNLAEAAAAEVMNLLAAAQAQEGKP